MPEYVDTETNYNLIRVLVYGFAKTKKTWWAGTAAEAGFNVMHLSVEKGGHGIFKHLSTVAKRRIFVMDCTDELNRPVAAEFFSYFCGGRKFYWHEQDKRVSLTPIKGYRCIDIQNLTRNVVLVVDPWTAIVESLVTRFCLENGIDMTDPKKPDWDHYRWCGALATHLLGQLMTLPCHVILIAHETMYEKRKEERGQSRVEWARRQIVSTSGPHAMTVPRKFDEVLHFEWRGRNLFIETLAQEGADGGGRFLAPGSYTWENLAFSVLADAAGIAPEQKELEESPGIYFPFVSDEQLQAQAAKSHGLINPAGRKKTATLFGK
jgi:hypothetical protein